MNQNKTLQGAEALQSKKNNPSSRWRAVCAPEWTQDLSFDTMGIGWEGVGEVKDWLYTGKGLVLYGEPGTGKTGLMCSILRAMAEAGVGDAGIWNLLAGTRYQLMVQNLQAPVVEAPVWFETWASLKRRLRTQFNSKTEEYYKSEDEIFLDLANQVEVLGLDDVDTDTYSDWKGEVFLRLVERPQRLRKTIIMTTNLSPDQWQAALGDRVGDRMLDTRFFRFVKMSTRHRG